LSPINQLIYIYQQINMKFVKNMKIFLEMRNGVSACPALGTKQFVASYKLSGAPMVL